MATVYITEYAGFGMFSANGMPTAMEPALADQTVAITADGTTRSAAFKNNTQLVRINTDAACSIAFGTTPTASATTRRLAINQTEYFCVPPPKPDGGSAYKVAVITNS